MHACNLATISQQLNTILIIRDDLRSIFWAIMVGATGIEPVTPAVSRQCLHIKKRTLSIDFFYLFSVLSKYCQTKEVAWQVLDSEEQDGMFK